VSHTLVRTPMPQNTDAISLSAPFSRVGGADVIFDPGLLSELLDHAHHPPVGDTVLRAFYGTLVQAVDAGEPVADVLMQVKALRPSITNKHLVNLLFRCFQYLRFQIGEFGYHGLQTVAEWREEILRRTLPMVSTELEGMLVSLSTATTIYQRYAGPCAVALALFRQQGLRVGDLGCGGNYGLRGLDVGEPFLPIRDETPGRVVSALLKERLNLNYGVGIDREPPDAEHVRSWRLACSVYPQEIARLADVIEFEQRMQASLHVDAVLADLLMEEPLPAAAGLDVVILSTVLYQLQRQDQIRVLTRARDTLREGGALIVQDFAEKNPDDPRRLDFNESWFGTGFTYRTFIASSSSDWQFLEALQWKTGRCDTVRPGSEFKHVFGTLNANP
jgi:hypothetical protein